MIGHGDATFITPYVAFSTPVFAQGCPAKSEGLHFLDANVIGDKAIYVLSRVGDEQFEHVAAR